MWSLRGPNDVVNCNATTYTTGPNDNISYSGANGITLNIDDGGAHTLSVTGASGEIAVGASGAAGANNPVVVNAVSFGTITGSGASGAGLRATANGTTASATITLTSGTVNVSGPVNAVEARTPDFTTNAGTATAIMNGGTISTATNTCPKECSSSTAAT